MTVTKPSPADLTDLLSAMDAYEQASRNKPDAIRAALESGSELGSAYAMKDAQRKRICAWLRAHGYEHLAKDL